MHIFTSNGYGLGEIRGEWYYLDLQLGGISAEALERDKLKYYLYGLVIPECEWGAACMHIPLYVQSRSAA